MKIDKYSFGRIRISGNNISHDLIITEKETKEWWRQKGHHVSMVDIDFIKKSNPDLVIFGTGYYGMMRIDSEVKQYLKDHKIELVCNKTPTAVKKFNDLPGGTSVIAAFHLTC